MADEISLGEVYRKLLDYEHRVDRIHAALDSRLTDLAKDTVPLTLYQQGERDRDKEIQGLKESIRQVRDDHAGELRELRERPQMTLGRWLAVGSVVVAILGVMIEAYAALKGAGAK